MTVGIAAGQHALDGALLLDRTEGRSSPSDLERRVTRTATLDGGATFTDRGYSDADRTLTIVQGKATRAEYETAAYLLRSFATVVVATREGVFLGTINTVSVRQGDLTISVLVSARLTEA